MTFSQLIGQELVPAVAPRRVEVTRTKQTYEHEVVRFFGCWLSQMTRAACVWLHLYKLGEEYPDIWFGMPLTSTNWHGSVPWSMRRI